MTTTIEKCPTWGGGAIDRSDFWETVVENGDEQNQKVQGIKKAIEKYYLALGNREHGGVAENNAFQEIQDILGLHWEQGKIKAHLDKHPKLKPFYT